MKICLTGLIALFILLGFSGCRHEKTYRIGVSQCSNDDWRRKMNDEIEREIMFHPEARLEIRSADDNNEKQIADIRYFLDNKFDLIIASPNEADAITPIIKEAYESGTPVVLFDRSINGNTYTAFVGADNVGLGRSTGEYAIRHVPDGSRILEITGRAGSTPAKGRHAGFAQAVAADSSVTVAHTVCGNWNYEDAYRVADSMLAVDRDINVIYAHNDRMAIAAREVARKHGLTPYIIGIDAAPEIGIQAVADSVINATFLYPTEGYRLVRTAMAILKNQPYDSIVSLPVSSAVDLSNADILLVQNETLREETSKMRTLKKELDDYWSRHSAQTSLFYATIAILLLVCGVLFLLLRAFWQHRRHQEELMKQNRLLEEQRDLQKSLNQQLTEATQSKLIFFTNVSHDLRTPLTLIAEPVEQLAKAENLNPRQHTLMQIADKNVRILRRLINQILDFRKYENGKIDLHLSEVNLAALMTDWANTFAAVARSRDIKLGVNVSAGADKTVAVDAEKIERVFFNLMSNAFKYTPDNGRITFNYVADEEKVVFSVSDNGQGIGDEDLTHIFERFYQVDRVRPKGSGIGLSLAKAFVELHDGTIVVQSKPGEGSTFTVTLPVRHVSATAEAPSLSVSSEDINAELGRIESTPDPENNGKPLLLVIDDNADIRKMLSELMSDDYNVITAPDGAQGLRLAARHVPDLIVCDVMMPVMDGLECCRRIKSEISTSHIPVLMLTACALDNQRVEGYDSGADGYISKPFGSEVLKARCRSLIANRQLIRELWKGNTPDTGVVTAPAPVSSDPSAPATVNDVENEFYTKFLRIAREKMSDPELSVDSLAAEMGLGRSQFYRKIKALTNYSPVELLRRLRLNTARQLLTTTDKTISEIAYEVGFSTPAYFTKCYREAFDQTPTQLREGLTK